MKTKTIIKSELTSKHKLALLFIALSSLMLEFTLIRTLSVSLWYHFAFMIISIALMGIGAGGVLLSVSNRLRNVETNLFLSVTSTLYSLSILVSFIIINKIPFDPFSLLVDSMQFIYLPLYYLFVTLPFLFAGLIISKLFSTFQKDIPKLYFFDLIGAGLSCFVFILIIPAFGGSGGVVAASLLASAGVILFSVSRSKFSTITLISGFVLLIINSTFLTNTESYLPIKISSNKVYANYMEDNPELKILTQWNSFSKVDVIRDDDPPIDQYPVHTAIIDAGNSTTNIPLVPEVKDTLAPPFDASNLAMLLKKTDSANVFIVGSGGGGEILSALSHNAKTVTAVEINPILNNLVEKHFANYWTKGIARNNKVKIITDDARSWLRGKRLKFDVIISAHTISASATNSGAMSLVENYIMTKEAVFDYLTHLKTDGILYITRPETQVPRLITTIRQSFSDNRINGIVNKSQFFIFKRPPSEFEKDISFLAGVVFKKDGFSREDILLMKTQASMLNLNVEYDPVSDQSGIFKEIIESKNIEEIYTKYPNDLEPVTDDRPYFEHQTKFSNLNIESIKESFSQTDRAILSMVQKPVAESTLIVLLIQTIILAGVFMLLPVIIKNRKNTGISPSLKFSKSIYFALLGLGYIMIEICLIQKFTLILGQPTYTLLTVVSTMLIFSGLGSLTSQGFLKLIKNNSLIIFGLIALITILIALLSNYFFNWIARADILWRITASVIIIAPLSYFMGMPLPIGMSKISSTSNNSIAYAWGINGFFSVIGSVLVVMLSMSYGFRIVLFISAACYITASFAMKHFKDKTIT